MELLFPLKGKHKGLPVSKQPPDTSPDLNNVRPYDVLDERARGGQRPGLDKLYSERIGYLPFPIVAMCSVTVVS